MAFLSPGVRFGCWGWGRRGSAPPLLAHPVGSPWRLGGAYGRASVEEQVYLLLAEDGYPNGFDMTITVPSNYKPHMDTAEVLVQQLAQIGVNATIEPIEWESWVSDVYAGRQFQSTVVGVDASTMTARALLERFTSDYGKNFINYNNAEYDALFQQTLTAYDDAEQTAIYKQMLANLTENAANVYIQDLADLVAVRKGVEGVTFYPIYVLDLANLHYTA